MDSQLLSVRSVSKSFKKDNQLIGPISLNVDFGERSAIVGQTGSGKSTLLKIIGGRLQTDSGAVYLKGERVLGPDEQLIAGHESIAYLSQHFELPKFISVEEHLKDAYLISNDEADEIYRACQIFHLLSRDTRELSGGEKQRVALAKLLLTKPEVILLDEPFSNLDFIHKRTIKGVIQNIETVLGTTVILVAHDPIDVMSWADRVIVLKEGRVVQEASSEEVYSQPADLYVAGLFGDYNLIKPKEWLIEGDFMDYGGSVLVRPEQIRESGGSGISGTIVQVHFCGSYDQVIARIDQKEIAMHSRPGQYKVGQELKLVATK